MGTGGKRKGEIQIMENSAVRWKETVDLSFELTDTTFTLLDALIDYCKKHNISLYQEEGLWNLVKRAQTIMKQIEYTNSVSFLNCSRRKVTDFDNRHQGNSTRCCFRLKDTETEKPNTAGKN